MQKEKDFYIDEETLLSTYEGHTIFSIYLQKHEVYEQILFQLKKSEFEDELNSLKKFVENNVLRRLYRILITPTDDLVQKGKRSNEKVNCDVCLSTSNQAKEDVQVSCFERFKRALITEDRPECNCKGFYSVSIKSVHFQNEMYRDNLIKISLFCRETDITNFVNSLDDMSKLMKSFNPTLNEFFENSCIQTKQCRAVKALEWVVGDTSADIKVLESNDSLIDEAQLNKKLAKEKDGHIFGRMSRLLTRYGIFSKPKTRKSLVEVKMLRTNWVFRQTKNIDNDFLQLIDTLDNVTDTSLYTTEIVEALI